MNNEDSPVPATLSPLEKARLAMAARRAAGEVSVHLTPVQKAIAKPTSRTFAIAANCYTCQGGNADSGVRWRIGNCTVGPLKEDESGCALYAVRPYQRLLGRPVPTSIACGNPADDLVDNGGENSGDGSVGEEGAAGEVGAE